MSQGWSHGIWSQQMKMARHALNECAALEREGYMVDLDARLGNPTRWRHMSGREFQGRMKWHQQWIEHGTTVPHAFSDSFAKRSLAVPRSAGEGAQGS